MGDGWTASGRLPVQVGFGMRGPRPSLGPSLLQSTSDPENLYRDPCESIRVEEIFKHNACSQLLYATSKTHSVVDIIPVSESENGVKTRRRCQSPRQDIVAKVLDSCSGDCVKIALVDFTVSVGSI